MMGNWQGITVLLIVAAAIAVVVYKLVSLLRGDGRGGCCGSSGPRDKKHHCTTGCDGCPLSGDHCCKKSQ